MVGVRTETDSLGAVEVPARVDRPADMVRFIREHVYRPQYVDEGAALARA
jgi:hypothetical protein